MRCEEIDELLAAYGVSALSPEEEKEVREHLAGCERHTSSLADVSAVVERLALVAQEREPPGALRARLLDAFDREVAAKRAASPEMIQERRLPAPRWRLAYAAMAALLFVAIGLTAWNVVLQSGEGENSTVVAALEGGSGEGLVVYLRDRGLVLLDVRLPELAPGRAYQAWDIRPSGPVSLGLVPSAGAVAVQADLENTEAIAISEEPAGGSRQPTTEPLLLASLR